MEGETALQYFLRKNRELAALKDAALRAGKNVMSICFVIIPIWDGSMQKSVRDYCMV